jgi:hypothetical protein
MHKQGAIILGIGGDNSQSSSGTFYQGVMTSGYVAERNDRGSSAAIFAANDPRSPKQQEANYDITG